ncbi:MobA-like NTP transferase domain-containing protein [Aspergillus egyptiacus]|nr:MobA-like NTP transferase domain-containing protein [Aspergillus egyptiacus]
MTVKPLLLAGGRSTRMGCRKELLCLTNNIPTYEHQLLRLHLACPHADAVFLSLPNPTALDQILANPRIEPLTDTALRLRRGSFSLEIRLLYDSTIEDQPQEPQEIGPAAGLLAAHRHDPRASWLVIACDYPFLSVSALSQLQQQRLDPVTCFQNAEGIYEPLLGVWSPTALALLERNVQNGMLGPKSVWNMSRL